MYKEERSEKKMGVMEKKRERSEKKIEVMEKKRKRRRMVENGQDYEEMGGLEACMYSA